MFVALHNTMRLFYTHLSRREEENCWLFDQVVEEQLQVFLEASIVVASTQCNFEDFTARSKSSETRNRMLSTSTYADQHQMTSEKIREIWLDVSFIIKLTCACVAFGELVSNDRDNRRTGPSQVFLFSHCTHP